MKTYIFIPPLAKMTGGVAVLFQVARHLVQGGFDACLVLREERSRAMVPEDLPTMVWDDLRLTPQDIWLVPEGWVNALTPGLNARARTVVYVQNWAYTFSALPEGVSWSQLKVSFLAVSQPVAWFLEQSVGVDCPVLRPGIDLGHFHPAESELEGRLSVAYMPRKNKALASQIRQIFESRRKLQGKEPAAWREIHGLDTHGVANVLRGSHLFLITGFPEGCPLPPLEAMASGCLCVGFSGFGGWDYMRQAQAGGFVPWWPLRPPEETPWSGNGLWAADADVMAAALALEQAADWIENMDPRWKETVAQAQATVAHYSEERQKEAVLALWRRAAKHEIFTT